MFTRLSSYYSTSEAITFVCMATQIFGLLLFSYGYFAVDDMVMSQQELIDEQLKMTPEALLHVKNIQDNCSTGPDSLGNYKEEFPKLVLIVIDALRADFIPTLLRTNLYSPEQSDTMPFTEDLLKTKRAIGVISEAQTPTVTMPRIKALLSGTHPSFLDLIVNLNAAVFGDDNLIQRAYEKRKRMIFYGDDTWLSMFPSQMFLRSNGTSSFFATDYVQVDTNVTECLLPELTKLDEWDYVVLHYLGVDHIGHSHGGARSYLMKDKLLEMDRVVKAIFDAANSSDERYLIVVTGDHGMTDVGNHGGSTAEETNTALLFIDTRTMKEGYRKKEAAETDAEVISVSHAKQIDVAVTLSGLLGLPIPEKSKGKLILPVLRKLNIATADKLCQLFRNSIQLQKMRSSASGPSLESFAVAASAHAEFLQGNRLAATAAIRFYANYLIAKQDSIMFEKSQKSQLVLMALGVAVSFLPGLALHFRERHRSTTSVWTIDQLHSHPINAVHAMHFILCAILLHSTSFMEMEHYYWFFMAASLMLVSMFDSLAVQYRTEMRRRKVMNSPSRVGSAIYNNQPSAIGTVAQQILVYASILVLLKVLSVWSVHGRASIGDFLADKHNKHLTSSLVILSLILISFSTSTFKIGRQQILLSSGLFWVYLYRSDLKLLNSYKSDIFFELGLGFAIVPVTKARLVYIHILFLIIEAVARQLKPDPKTWLLIEKLLDDHTVPTKPSPPPSSRMKKFSQIMRCTCTCVILCATLLGKVQNIPIVALNIILEKLVHRGLENSLKPSRAITFLTTYFTFAMMSFYSVGNSNFISTIDVSSGFVGLTSYNPILVGILVTLNTFSMYIYWLLMMFVRIDEARFSTFHKLRTERMMSSLNFLLFARFTTVAVYEIIAVVLQNHLFIWSVICPKLLYEGAITLVTDVVALVVVSGHKLFVD